MCSAAQVTNGTSSATHSRSHATCEEEESTSESEENTGSGSEEEDSSDSNTDEDNSTCDEIVRRGATRTRGMGSQCELCGSCLFAGFCFAELDDSVLILIIQLRATSSLTHLNKQTYDPSQTCLMFPLLSFTPLSLSIINRMNPISSFAVGLAPVAIRSEVTATNVRKRSARMPQRFLD